MRVGANKADQASALTPGTPLANVATDTRQKAATGGPTPAEIVREGQKRADESSKQLQVINGPAGNPECVWLGRRVVGLLWRDDLDTAFRHLDLYDRFGCPGGHVQATFRCLDAARPRPSTRRSADSLNGHVQACWINPNATPQPAALNQPATPAPAAAAAPAAQPDAKPDAKPADALK